MTKKQNIFAFDIESNGLWGQPFAVAAVLMDKETGKVLEKLFLRCPIEGTVNQFVEENVLPQCKEKVNCDSYAELLVKFVEFYKKHQMDADFVVQVGFPVEARFLTDIHTAHLLGDFDFPFPLIDISAFPDVSNTTDYVQRHGIGLPQEIADLSVHNPLYDCFCTAATYRDKIR